MESIEFVEDLLAASDRRPVAAVVAGADGAAQ
jgi:hypothetical protein